MVWRSSLSLVLGLWLIAAAFALRGAAEAYAVAVSGLAVAALALWSLLGRERPESSAPKRSKAA